MDSALLPSKRASPAKIAIAIVMILAIVGIIFGLLNFVTYESARRQRVSNAPIACTCAGTLALAHFRPSNSVRAVESHWHIFHPDHMPKGQKAPPMAILGVLIFLYPLLTIAGMMLVIPLIMYMTDHAPFQSLNLPKEYWTLLTRIYTTWAQSTNGKMKVKDM